jgi:nicotinate-nucleotide adenylyltransferase
LRDDAAVRPAPRRIGLFGGSFDPPHLAHRALADLALAQLRLDELRWLPAGQPWQKAARALAPRADRVAMLRLLMAGEPRFLLDERELERTGPSYTIDTVRELAAEHPGAELLLVIGQDQYGRFDTWREWRELLQRATLAVAGRDGAAPTPPAALAAQPHRLLALSLPAMPVSSTQIRTAAAQGLRVDALVGPVVAGYIDDQHLYLEKA